LESFAPTQACLASRSTCDHSRPSTLDCRNPLAKVKVTTSR
jgi:hypothetical protein